MRAFERGATTLGVQVARSLYDRWRRMPAAVPSVSEPAATVPSDVSDIEVRDLRAQLTRELERLANADIAASRGPGGVAGETASADEQA